MPNRTQQEGRTPYTEHDFVFDPRWNVDLMERMNNVWLRMLLWETRRFDPTFDPNTKRDQMDTTPGDIQPAILILTTSNIFATKG